MSIRASRKSPVKPGRFGLRAEHVPLVIAATIAVVLIVALVTIAGGVIINGDITVTVGTGR